MTVGGHDLGADADLSAGALRIVQYILKLQLTRVKWNQVAEHIEAAIEAAAAGDLEGLRRATNDLMLASPVRIIKPDGATTEPADQKIFERANVLIHELQSMRPFPAEDKDSKRR
jgi:hypothetical protein